MLEQNKYTLPWHATVCLSSYKTCLCFTENLKKNHTWCLLKVSFWLLFIWFDSIIINFVFISGSVVSIVTCSFFGILRWGVLRFFFFFCECLFLSAPSIEVLALVWKGFLWCKTCRLPRISFFQDYLARYWSESESPFFFFCAPIKCFEETLGWFPAVFVEKNKCCRPKRELFEP